MAIVDVIKWEVNTTELVHKFPADGICLGSQLVVYPSQTAFFVRGGEIINEYECGTYTIDSENIPLLNKLVNLPFGGNSPFPADVWFVNQISILDCKWGTATPIQIEDPKYSVIVPIRSYGQYGFKIMNPRTFFERLVGNMSSISTETILSYFKGVILSKLTALISQKLYADNISVVNINSFVETISDFVKRQLIETFEDYGIELKTFNIIAINVNENDESFIKLKETKDALARINIMGRDNYRLDRSFNVLESAAENKGTGIVGASVGIGAGLSIGNQIGNIAREHLNQTLEQPPVLNQNCQYYVAINGEQYGPATFHNVCEMISNGQIDESTLCWKRGLSDWVAIINFNEFKNYFKTCPPPLI
ncbi:MAG: SPFH domain-containing protein [Muribaculaceae bacterium]|nr:SPFH domain-containing protein [Muribaculaceae bacterium]